jgi:hypothetical protein
MTSQQAAAAAQAEFSQPPSASHSAGRPFEPLPQLDRSVGALDRNSIERVGLGSAKSSVMRVGGRSQVVRGRWIETKKQSEQSIQRRPNPSRCFSVTLCALCGCKKASKPADWEAFDRDRNQMRVEEANDCRWIS